MPLDHVTARALRMMRRRHWVLFEAHPASVHMRRVERRRNARIALDLPVRVLWQACPQSVLGRLRDVSCGGAFIHCDVLPEIGTQVALGFRIGGNDGPLTITARAFVVRCEHSAEGHGFAVQFSWLPQDKRRALMKVALANL
ncbi:MAG: PilZ domain-containing protein [Myxococcales bacterium]|nr:PilZ domain-containing protein [Myxococcales bacterium]